jgi:hypothetical protein
MKGAPKYTSCLRLCLAALGLLLCAGALAAAPAGAAVVSVGPELKSLNAGGHNVECTSPSGCLVSQKSPSYTSPLTGMVVGWRVKASSGTLTLRVLDGNTGVLGAATATAEAGKTLPARIPVEVGERFGVAIPHVSGTNLGFAEKSGSTFSAWSPALVPGEARPPDQNTPDAELLFNVLVQPPPGISAVMPASGPVDTQDTVTISGHDFIGVEDVSFGAFSAEYEVVSETTIVAKASSSIASAVPLTITTRAGTISAPGAFTFEEALGSGVKPPDVPPLTIPIIPSIPPDLSFPAEVECHVPKLKGKTLKQAKPVLAAAHCKLGKVTKRRGVNAKRARVVSELPAGGSHAPENAGVQVRLG